MESKESTKMNEVNNSASTAAVRPVPLFASSWVALYCFLRNSLLDEPQPASEQCAPEGGEDQAAR